MSEFNSPDKEFVRSIHKNAACKQAPFLRWCRVVIRDGDLILSGENHFREEKDAWEAAAKLLRNNS